MQSMQMPHQTHQGPGLPPPQQQVYHHAPLSQSYQSINSATTATSAQTNSNSPSPPKEKRSRRWSLAGRLFDKRKSITQPFNNIPASSSPQTCSLNNTSQPPLTINTTYNNNGKAPYSDDQQHRVSPVGSGGSGGSGGSSGSGHSGGCSGSRSGHRRSSLADIPKAILSSLRRGSHSSSSETANKEKEPTNNNGVPAPVYHQQRQRQHQQQQYQQAEDRVDSPFTDNDDDNDSTTAPCAENDQERYQQQRQEKEFQPSTATILTANGLMQATMAVPKAPPPSFSQDAAAPPAIPIKSILKKQSPSSSPPSPPSPTSPLSRMQKPNNSNNYVHPMTGYDGQMGGFLQATDHRARLETSSPITSHPHFHQQQQSQQKSGLPLGWTPAPGGIQPLQYPTTPAHYTGYGNYGEKTIVNPTSTTYVPLSKPSTELMDDRYLPQGGAAFPPDYTPGMQSNVFQDRGGERSQGQVLDYRMMEMDPSFSFQGAPAAAASAAADSNGYHQHRDPSFAPQAHHQYNYGYDQNSSIVDGPQSMTTTMMHERDGYGSINNNNNNNNSNNNYSYFSTRNGSYSSYNSHGILLTGNGIARRPKTIGFTDTIEIIPAYRKSEYNRRSDKFATFKNLTPDLKIEIRDELNAYKMREMAVHVESMGNTAFH
ncbi:hypothetical protein BGZ95_001368 [Linnemannia exigua]|uniref:Uncharacterized protein n=1 Tax=Linnemannia exigua TaxID=604196 RepID=A0AAD4DIY5_9FUNG|nr:hypothetical protein BGZ95_001368 [Linnemannia exigua]